MAHPKFTPEERRDYRRKVVHGTFIREGLMVALPLCFPGVSRPPSPDESRVAALEVDSTGMVYGVTRGRAVHLFAGMTHGATGAVVDLGVAEGATDAVNLCCAGGKIFVGVQTDRGGCLASRPAQDWPFDLLQEWSFRPHPLVIGDPLAPGCKLLGLARDRDGSNLVAVTEGALHRIDPETGGTTLMAEMKTAGGPRALGDRFIGYQGEGQLWSWDAHGFRASAVQLPTTDADVGDLVWSAGGHRQVYLADASGRLMRLEVGKSTMETVEQLPLTPVTTMTEAPDGRLYIFAGEGMQRLFCYDPQNSTLCDLGCAISVFQSRRYGYEFACGAVGHDGRLFFGEDDMSAHLWIYMPACRHEARNP